MGLPQGELDVHERARRRTIWEGSSDESQGTLQENF